MSQGNAKHETGTTLGSHPQLYPFILEHIGETPVQKRLRDDIAKEARSVMMGAPDEAQFLAWLCRLIGARKVLEVGVFRGSTTLAIALALPKDGQIVGLDICEDFATLGKKAWSESGVSNKVDFRVGPAAEIMQDMIVGSEKAANTFDLAFIDADKCNYDTYYELCLQLVRVGGVIAVDNVLWGGSVIQPIQTGDVDTATIVALDEKIKKDSRVEAVMLPIADGCYLVRRIV